MAWIIETDAHCVGVVRLHSLVEQDRRARLAIGLFHPALLGHGTGTLAIRLVLQHAFDGLHLHRVDLRVLAFNVRAIRCYEKCGFVREGLERAKRRAHQGVHWRRLRRTSSSGRFERRDCSAR
ncbi:MAG: GNAT family N-acetyltransferase [Chloroflexi bacterium]|nr:GNAT family N-acetyltransferase [Chloroflexota bacterium]MBV9894909.1 GNAT family N-acetyltransferase [Chloroflexota bacterium]